MLYLKIDTQVEGRHKLLERLEGILGVSKRRELLRPAPLTFCRPSAICLQAARSASLYFPP